MSAQEARPKGVLLVARILLFAAVMVAVYWIIFFSGPSALSLVQCYMTFEQTFPAADAWMAVAGLLGCIGLLRRRSWGVLFALLAGSASIYLGLMDVFFDLENGIYFRLYSAASTEVAVEITINVLTLTLGPAIIWYVWSRRRLLL
jgi:hypothetical protein